MKKILFIFLLVMLITANLTFADIIPVNDVLFTSISENDGTIALGCTVYNSDGTICGTNSNEQKYLENLLPRKLVAETQLAFRSGLNSLYKTVVPFDEFISIQYTSENQNMIFEFSNSEALISNNFDIQIKNLLTNKVVARGNNLNSNEEYVLVNDYSNIPLEVSITDSNNATVSFFTKSKADILYQNYDNMFSDTEGLNEEAFSTLTNVVTTRYVTSTVPKNIDGTQGQFLISHVVKGDSGHRIPHSKFISGTNSMSTINLASYYAGVNLGLAMNVTLGQEIDWNYSLGIGDTMSIKMSTNSNTGSATIDMIDQTW